LTGGNFRKKTEQPPLPLFVTPKGGPRGNWGRGGGGGGGRRRHAVALAYVPSNS